MNKILVVDDELSIRESFSLILDGKYKVVTAASGEGALKAVTDHKIDLAYLDIRMPGLDGLETLKRMKEIDPAIEIVMVTAVNEVHKASEAIKLGARDYIIKPFDVEAIQKMTASILRRRELLRAMAKTSARLIGRSEKILSIVKTIETIAPQNTRVLILGEPGTEKELAAQMIHEKSPRGELPFIVFDLYPGVSKTALFGMEKGTTTMDLEKQKGLFDQVRGGTLLLNNIEFLSAELLSDLPSAEARLLGASNLTDFSEKVKPVADFFSETIITVPPLRERITDLPFMLNEILEELSLDCGKEVLEISPQIGELLSSYTWPGNTRQLKSFLERLVLTAPSSRITEENLPLDILLLSSESPGSEYLSNFEKYAQGRTRTGTAYTAEGF